MSCDLQSTDWGEHPPLEFALPAPQPSQPEQRFIFDRGVRPDLTHWYAYSCMRCGFTVGLDWLRMGVFELLTHDCRYRCCHLAFVYEATPEGEKFAKTIPAFRRDGKCWRCGAHYSETCRSDQ